jgi:hypothetical protein
MKYLYLSLLAGLFVFSGCHLKNKKKQTADEIFAEASKVPGANAGVGKFNLVIPDGWERVDTSLQALQVTFLFAPPVDTIFRTNINIVSESMKKYTLEEYVDITVPQMKQARENVVVGPKILKNINGTNIIVHVFSTDDKVLPTEGITAYYPINGVIYIITLTTRRGLRTDYQKVFDEVLFSFKKAS